MPGESKEKKKTFMQITGPLLASYPLSASILFSRHLSRFPNKEFTAAALSWILAPRGLRPTKKRRIIAKATAKSRILS